MISGVYRESRREVLKYKMPDRHRFPQAPEKIKTSNGIVIARRIIAIAWLPYKSTSTSNRATCMHVLTRIAVIPIFLLDRIDLIGQSMLEVRIALSPAPRSTLKLPVTSCDSRLNCVDFLIALSFKTRTFRRLITCTSRNVFFYCDIFLISCLTSIKRSFL